jgi:hypothetical protein
MNMCSTVDTGTSNVDSAPGLADYPASSLLLDRTIYTASYHSSFI